MRTFFISDTHFGHKNIIRYENRPFSSVSEMNEKMIESWNSVVGANDRVIHGGDFALCPKPIAIDIFNRLNGEKHLVLGNHDGSKTRILSIGFKTVEKFWQEDGVLVWHDPATVPQTLYDECNIFLYGHVHSKSVNLANSKNISVEVLNYTPTCYP